MTTLQITFNEKTEFGKNLLALLELNKKLVKLKYPTKLSEEEFDAKIQEARDQYARGEYKTLLPGESIFDFLNRI